MEDILNRQSTRGGPLAWVLGEVLTNCHRNKIVCYKTALLRPLHKASDLAVGNISENLINLLMRIYETEREEVTTGWKGNAYRGSPLSVTFSKYYYD